MSGFVIRAATMADLPAIVALLADDDLGRGREDPRMPPHPAYVAALEAIMADPHQEQLVALRAGEVVGTLQVSYLISLSRRGARRAQLEGMRVAASARGAGIGEALVEAAVERSRARGCTLVQLTSDRTRTRAHAFYERLGFTASHVGFKRELSGRDERASPRAGSLP